MSCFFFFQAEDGIRDVAVTGVQTCALPILRARDHERNHRGAEGAVPQLAVPHPIARRGERLVVADEGRPIGELPVVARLEPQHRDRKSTRLNSSHGYISYAVFCLKKKKTRYTKRC